MPYQASHNVLSSLYSICALLQVAGEAVAAFASALGLPGPESLPPVVFRRCQLWGAGGWGLLFEKRINTSLLK